MRNILIFACIVVISCLLWQISELDVLPTTIIAIGTADDVVSGDAPTYAIPTGNQRRGSGICTSTAFWTAKFTASQTLSSMLFSVLSVIADSSILL